MRTFPAIDVAWARAPAETEVELLIAAVDDAGPTAVEDQPYGARVFFGDEARRDEAASLVRLRFPTATVTALLVPDDDWAERSQAALRPALIDNVVVSPPWALDEARAMRGAAGQARLIIAIQPSMGFGTGHHASTRLCLRLLQRTSLAGITVLDIGTGSGVLAITACRLGAVRARGIDVDRDALAAAAENVERNGVAGVVALDEVDITRHPAAVTDRFGLVFANITGAMLQQHAPNIAATLDSGGSLITSGFQTHEYDDVAAALGRQGLQPLERVEEDTWVAASFTRR